MDFRLLCLLNWVQKMLASSKTFAKKLLKQESCAKFAKKSLQYNLPKKDNNRKEDQNGMCGFKLNFGRKTPKTGKETQMGARVEAVVSLGFKFSFA